MRIWYDTIRPQKCNDGVVFGGRREREVLLLRKSNNNNNEMVCWSMWWWCGMWCDALYSYCCDSRGGHDDDDCRVYKKVHLVSWSKSIFSCATTTATTAAALKAGDGEERRKKEERRVNGFFTAEWKLLMCGGMDGMHVNQMDWNGTCLLTRLFSGSLNSKFGRSMWRRRERKNI